MRGREFRSLSHFNFSPFRQVFISLETQGDGFRHFKQGRHRLIRRLPLQIGFHDSIIKGDEPQDGKIRQILSEELLVGGAPDLAAHNGDLLEAQVAGQVSDMQRGFDAAAPRLHHDDQAIHPLGRRPSQMFDARLHVHDHHLIPEQHHMGHQVRSSTLSGQTQPLPPFLTPP